MFDVLFEKTLCGIEMSHIKRDSDFTMDIKHLHDDYEIYYLLSGERNYFIGQQTYHIKQGGLALINRHEIHKTGQIHDPFHERILIEIKKEPLSALLDFAPDFNLEEFFSHTNRVYQLSKAEQLETEKHLFSLLSIMKKQETGYQLMILSKVAELLFYFKKILSDRTKDMETGEKPNSYKRMKVNEVTNYLSTHYATANSLDDVAKHFFMNKSYLSRIYKEITGLTINEYLNIKRVQKAQQLLVTTTLNITEIAELVGYNSITYFERIFRKYSELSPLQYRKR